MKRSQKSIRKMVEQMSIALKMNLKITNKQNKIMNYKGSTKYKKLIIQDFKQFKYILIINHLDRRNL